MIASVKKTLATPYLRLSLAHARRKLVTSAPRSFATTYIVAELSRNTGISQGARLQYAFFRRQGVNVELLDATQAARNPLFKIPHQKGTAYIFHCGGPQIATLLRSVLPQAACAYRIAYWAWELPTPPRGWPPAEGLISEIWSCSKYSCTSLQSAYQVPVLSVPHVLSTDTRAKPRSTNAERFEVLCFADVRSSLQRKNPFAAIAAFRQAFGNTTEARLTIKLNGNPSDLLSVTRQITGSPNIRVITDFLNLEALSQLYHSSSVLLSLHRAEGFGLPMLEAMSHGLPVIATNWSGNLEYMAPENSMLVPYSLIQIGDDTVYSNYAEIEWANPDIATAATYLRTLAAEPGTYAKYSASALEAVRAYASRQSAKLKSGIIDG